MRNSASTSTEQRRAHGRHAHGPLGTAHTTIFSPDAMRRLLATTQVTSAESYLERGNTVEDYRASIYLYMDRFTKTGDLTTLAKGVLKAVSLHDYLLEHGPSREEGQEQE